MTTPISIHRQSALNLIAYKSTKYTDFVIGNDEVLKPISDYDKEGFEVEWFCYHFIMPFDVLNKLLKECVSEYLCIYPDLKEKEYVIMGLKTLVRMPFEFKYTLIKSDRYKDRARVVINE